MIIAMITHFWWNNSDSSHFIRLFVTAGLYAFQEIIHQTGAQKDLELKRVYLALGSEACAHSSSFWKQGSYSLATEKYWVLNMHKPLFSVSSWGSQLRPYHGKLKHSPRGRCMTDFLFQKDWLSFQNCWETLVQEMSCVCNLHLIHGKDFI